MVISIESRVNQNQENDHPELMMLYQKRRRPIRVLDQWTVLRFLDRLIKYKDNGWKKGNAAEHAHDNTLRHDNTDVAAQRKGHTAQCQKACHRRDRASDDGFKGRCNRMPHRKVPVIRVMLFILLIAVQKENRVVHRDTQLKDCSQRLCNIRNLPEENITSKVVYNCKPDTHQEENRHEERFRCQQ